MERLNVKRKSDIIKKIFCILLVLSMVLSFTGCGLIGLNDYVEKPKVVKVKKGADDGSGGKYKKSEVRVYNLAGHEVEIGDTVKFIKEKGDVNSVAANESSLARQVFLILYNSFGTSTDDIGKLYGGIKAEDIQGVNLSPSSVIGAIEGIAIDLGETNIAATLRSVAMGILVLIWSVQFLQSIVQERFTFESMLKGMMFLIISILVVQNSTAIVEAFISLGKGLQVNEDPSQNKVNDFLQAVKAYADGEVTYTSMGIDILGGVGIGTMWDDKRIGLSILYLIPPILGLALCAYQLITALFTRLIELQIRITCAPIPFAFASGQGFGPGAISFVKSTLACAMQPAIILIAFNTLDALTGAVQTLFGTSLLAQSLSFAFVYMVLSGFIGQSKSMAQEVIAR